MWNASPGSRLARFEARIDARIDARADSGFFGQLFDILDYFNFGQGGGDPEPAPGDPQLYATYTSGAQDTADQDFYNIELQFYGDGWSDPLLDAFVASADFLSSEIATGLYTDSATNTFKPALPANFFDIDDLVIEVYLEDIDGLGRTVGGGAPVYVRSSDGVTADEQTVLGKMEFDSADAQLLLAGGTFDDVVLHEMMHVLGVGTLWSGRGLIGLRRDDGGTPDNPADDGFNAFYRGAEATKAYWADTFQFGFLEIETDGGRGTAFGHWDEAALGNELMTGVVNSFNRLADYSLAALEDLGYELGQDYSRWWVNNPLSRGIDLVAENEVALIEPDLLV